MSVAVDFANYRGELAALATAFCWTASALAFTAAAKRLGSLVLNLVRLAIALGFIMGVANRRKAAAPVANVPPATA